MIHILRLIRVNNLLIMMCTQVLSYYFFSNHILLNQLTHTRFIFLCIATVLVAAGGYIINDYLDIKLDLINKPNKVVVGQYISRRWTMFLHLTLNLVAIFLGLYIGTKVTISIVVAAAVLWMYSVTLKQKFLIGNIMVGVLSALVIIINYIFDTSLSLNLVIAYSVFAFVITVLREIIKDTEDMRGDGKFNCKTIPLVLGVRQTKKILLYITVTFIAMLFLYVTFYAANFPFVHSITRGTFLFYMLFFVITPLVGLLYLLKIADTTSDFTRLSNYTKVIMILGMLSMVFWRL